MDIVLCHAARPYRSWDPHQPLSWEKLHIWLAEVTPLQRHFEDQFHPPYICEGFNRLAIPGQILCPKTWYLGSACSLFPAQLAP